MVRKSDPRKGDTWLRVRQQVLKRDMKQNAPCHICGEPIDYTLTHPHPDCWVPDHVKPVSKYPHMAYWLDNMRPAHASCNIKRGDKEIKTVEKRSRRW